MNVFTLPRPLPDERPRQSVANLIGRFEKQKSASAAPVAVFPPVFQRTSSVASHHTGDSAIEEIKEKREWPPKRVVDASSTTASPPTLNPEKEPNVEPSSIPSPSDKEPPSPKDPPAPEPPVEAAPVPLPKADLSPPVPPPTKSAPTKTAAPRTPISTKFSTSRPSIKSPSSTPQKSAAGASASATPLKPQHTGQSASSTRTPAPKASTVAKSSAATPPARVKTPVRTKTPIIRVKSPPSTARPKTPSTVRPKTPSSGLYAPTAASLARSKNAPTRLVEEKPKRRITTDLSKPTAASASKVRTSVATPSKVTKPSMAKPGPPRSAISIGKTTAKPVSRVAVGKAGTTATRVKNEGPAAAHPAGATTVSEVSHDNIDIATLGDTTNSHEVTEEVAEEPVSDTENNQVESYDNDSPEDGDIGHGEPAVETFDDHSAPGHDSAATDEAHDTHTEQPEENAQEQPHANGVAEPEFNTAENTLVTSHLDNHMEEDTIHAKIIPRPVGTDLEDIVNMLESVPIVHRPDLETTTTSAPPASSDTDEIPDEF